MRHHLKLLLNGLDLPNNNIVISLYEPNQNVIMSVLAIAGEGIVTKRTTLARNLNSSDSIKLCYFILINANFFISFLFMFNPFLSIRNRPYYQRKGQIIRRRSQAPVKPKFSIPSLMKMEESTMAGNYNSNS